MSASRCRYCCTVALGVALFCTSVSAQIFTPPDHRGAYATPASKELIEFEIYIDDELIADVTVRDGTFATVKDNESYYGISPLMLEDGTFSFVVYELERLPDGREKIYEREVIDFADYDSKVFSKKTKYSFIIRNVLEPPEQRKMRMSCDRCCIYCNGRNVCACSVSTSCGSCCCSDCCSE